VFTQNYFELFDLPPRFDVDLAKLADAYRRLQKQIHPDKFSGQPASEQRMAVQYASQVNQAFNALRHPALRAEYLLQLVGQQGQDHLQDTSFLMQQMHWREALMDVPQSAAPLVLLEELQTQVEQEQQDLERLFAQAFAQSSWGDARASLGKMQFVNKLLSDIHALEDQLLNDE
jgi:molecular chaperone HscB